MAFNSKLKDEFVDKLFEAILLLENEEECYRFFEDICTVSEIKSLAQRLEVAKMAYRKQDLFFYFRLTGASTATVSQCKTLS